MNIPKYEEIRKPAPHTYRPAAQVQTDLTMLVKGIKSDVLTVGAVECFDTMIQERVAVLYVEMDGIVRPLAIFHNGDITQRLVPCCGVESVKGDEVTENGLTPEEWDLLPCFEAMEGN